MWSCGSSRVPFIELTRTPYLSELDFGWLRIHIKIDWRPKGWDEAQFQARSIKGRVKRKTSPATGRSEDVRRALQPKSCCEPPGRLSVCRFISLS